MLSAAELKAVLRANGLRLTKRLGQHHLIDAGLARRLVDSMALPPDAEVVEIGAGLGALTELIADRVRVVIAVEVDRRIAELLAERLASRGNVRVVCQDILAYDWTRHAGAHVVGAIPYHITSPILVRLSEVRERIAAAWLVMQREVAKRLTARPGGPDYGRLSVLAQYAWDVADTMRLPPHAFFPQPDVDSACVRLLRRPAPAVAVADEALFFRVVQAALAHRRKTLVNCLADDETGVVSRPAAEAVVKALGWPADVRGERLSLEAFGRLTSRLAGERLAR